MSVHTGGGATVIMDPPPLVYVNVFRKASGPDGHIKRRANAVAFSARSIVPRRTGRLMASINVAQNRDEHGNFSFGYKVWAETPYAHYVHEGTAPHVYFSHPGKMRFAGTNRFSGQVVFTDMIDHPGTPANPFLQDALVAMVG